MLLTTTGGENKWTHWFPTPHKAHNVEFTRVFERLLALFTIIFMYERHERGGKRCRRVSSALRRPFLNFFRQFIKEILNNNNNIQLINLLK